jgi:hypothetical protein
MQKLSRKRRMLYPNLTIPRFHPPANSQDEKARGKRKRADADEGSESSSASQPKFVVPISSAAPAPHDWFDMTENISS